MTKIALVGNPNCGKTTLFNALTGSNQYVGNWPGVTVEKKEGHLIGFDDVIITDLPGIYSLAPYTSEEVVARNYLVEEKPDAILNIIDGTNLERSLYLTTQLVELGIPVIIAINMMDVVRKNGDEINITQLSKNFGCKVAEISALKETGLMEAAEMAVEASLCGRIEPKHNYSGSVEHCLAHIEEACVHHMKEEDQRWYAIKIFERDSKVLSQLDIPSEVMEHIEKDIHKVELEMDDDSESIIINERYNYISSIIKLCLKRKNEGKLSVSERIDQIVTNRYLGLPVFALIMFLVYYISMVSIGAKATDWTNEKLFGDGFYFLGTDFFIPGIPVVIENILNLLNCADWLKGLVLNGIIAGVGSVLGFVPQMFVLFFLLAFLEACGYMSRIAFVLDKIFRKFGLSGKSFIPILVGTGCGVPGIMASRTIESESDRRMTVMTTTFMPCSAKVPFISLIAGSIFGGNALVSTSAYFAGMISIIISGLILKRTKPFASKPAPFVLELPAYHLPTLKNVARVMWERGWEFVKKATTIILISTIVVWFTSYFGWTERGFGMLTETELGNSILAKLGHFISWIFIPLGFGTWEATVATITGLIAKENIVGTLGVLYGNGGNLHATLATVFNPVSAYAFLLFNLLCAPCVAAMGAIKREMNSKKWFWFAIGYQCGFAYIVALLVNQIGNLIFRLI